MIVKDIEYPDELGYEAVIRSFKISSNWSVIPMDVERIRQHDNARNGLVALGNNRFGLKRKIGTIISNYPE